MTFILIILLVALSILYYQKMKKIEELDSELTHTYSMLTEVKIELDNLVEQKVSWAEDLRYRLHDELNLFGYTNGGSTEPRSREDFATEMRKLLN